MAYPLKYSSCATVLKTFLSRAFSLRLFVYPEKSIVQKQEESNLNRKVFLNSLNCCFMMLRKRAKVQGVVGEFFVVKII